MPRTRRANHRSRASSHPDSHRRSWSLTRSTGRWRRPGRGLRAGLTCESGPSPPVRGFTDPGARWAFDSIVHPTCWMSVLGAARCCPVRLIERGSEAALCAASGRRSKAKSAINGAWVGTPVCPRCPVSRTRHRVREDTSVLDHGKVFTNSMSGRKPCPKASQRAWVSTPV
jgi:hypothetical protein